MTRAVIDTNWLVSGLLNKPGAPAKLILRWLKGQADFLVTKNTKHFPRKSYQNIRIVKVSQFLEELEGQFSS